MVVGDFQQAVKAVLLVTVEDVIDARLVGEPLPVAHLLPPVPLEKRLGIDLEGRVLADVPLDDAEDFRGDILGGVPVLLVPLLQDGDGTAGDLDVQLDVLGQAGQREVGGADQTRGADDLGVGRG